jgi:hypothetical protein
MFSGSCNGLPGRRAVRWPLVIAVALLAGVAAAPASSAIKIYQTSDDATLLGKIKKGECVVKKRGGDKFFRARARSTNRDFLLDLEISAPDWRGYGREYKFRYGAPDEKVFYLVGRGNTYSNAFAPPGLGGQEAGGVAFRAGGGKMSAGFLPTPTRDLRKGVVLAGAMKC